VRFAPALCLVGLLCLILAGCADEGARPPVVVRVATTKGAFTLELDPERAPITVANYLAYVEAGFYSGTIVHRVIPGFIVQGGGYDAEMAPRTPIRPRIVLEARNGLKNVRGAVAMARRSDPNSADCQFYINVKDNPNLDYPKPDGNGYAVFGRVVEGMAVVDSIEAAPTHAVGQYNDVPVTPIVILSAERVRWAPRPESHPHTRRNDPMEAASRLW
jgi:peptidyl-prolyl cis-trans isomerase A (cyclophilin A)